MSLRTTMVFLAAVGALFFSPGGQAQSAPGVIANGTVTFQGPRGAEKGTITVSAWGEEYCKVTITLGLPILRRGTTAVMNGKRVVITAPADIAGIAPLPIRPAIGCGFLPEGVAYDKIAAVQTQDGAAVQGQNGGQSSSQVGGQVGAPVLALDADGRPVSLSWNDREGPASLTYAQYQVAGGLLLPGNLTETVAGKTVLQIAFQTITSHSFTAADFPLPPAPSRTSASRTSASTSAGGVQ